METVLTTGGANFIGRPVTAIRRETPGTGLNQDRLSDIQNQRSPAFSALEAERGHG
ncbi:MAG: hypothetical protein NTY98_06450 [Verrucomicrobia bacterium]|nr:hypothetical protein [Verrucomicrobiota bacterium]